MPAPVNLRRARPLLGTLVEIQASGDTHERLTHAIDRAFSAIARVQQLMSYHDPQSDVSRLNRFAVHRPVKVSDWTWTVLRRARTLSRRSGGSFDITIAPRLIQWGLLPGNGLVIPSGGNWHAIQLLAGRRVRFMSPLALDLGGIAKGYAVDRAVAVLRSAGVSSALVNAGGDLRCYGSIAYPVQVRHPTRPGHYLPLAPLSNLALATSALTFTSRRWRGNTVGALIDARTGRACGRGLSISVRAPSAWLADALTKVVAADPAGAEPLLLRYGAEAMIFSRHNFPSSSPDHAG